VVEKVTHLLWQAANKPPGIGEQEGICRICGLPGHGLAFSGWVRPTFTDWDKLLPGMIICHACQFCFVEQSKLLAQRVGKEKPQRMRNYSHFVIGGKWLPLSKADKAQMARILLYEDWQVAIIAQSGQKHIIFRARPSTIQLEEQQISDWHDLGSLLATIETLYSGFSKPEIKTGDYAQHRILRFGASFWWTLESELKSERQVVLFELALFLAQKGEKDGRTESATTASGSITRGDMAGHPVQLQISL